MSNVSTFDVPTGAQACTRCGKTHPLNEDWFDRDAEKPTGFKGTCKDCRKEQRLGKRQSNLRRMVKQQQMTVTQALAQMDDGGSNCPHSAELMEKVFMLMGGVNGFAKILVTELMAAPPGSQMRQRAIAGLLKLTTDVTASGAAKVPKHLMDDEDIEREMNNLIIKLKLHKGDVIDADGTAQRVG